MQLVRKAYITAIIAFLTLSLALAAIPMASAQPSVPTFTPDSGPVGTKVTIGGTATPGAEIRIYWETITEANLLNTTWAVGTGGAFSVIITVPEDVKGDHTVYIYDMAAHATTSKTFAITSEIKLKPNKGLPGDSVTVTGTGFAGEAEVRIYFGTITSHTDTLSGDGSKTEFQLAHYPVVLSTVTVTQSVSAESLTFTGSGTSTDPYTETLANTPIVADSVTITVEVTITDGAASGSGTVTIEDDTTGALTGSAGITVDGTTVTVTFSGDVNYDTGVITLTVTTSGGTSPTLTITSASAAYTPNIAYVINYPTGVITFAKAPTSDVTINVSYSYADYDVTPIGGVTTSALGSFEAAIEVPSVTQHGDYDVTAYDAQGNSDSETLKVDYYILVEPTSAPVGFPIRVTGRMAPDSTVDIFFGKGGVMIPVLDDVPTDEIGNFTATFNVPEVSVATDYIVRAVDAEGNEREFSPFAVTEKPTITLSANIGFVGDTIIVTGLHFSANAKCTIWFGTINITSFTTGSDGSFSKSFKVPDVPVGKYKVKAEDEYGKSATADFTVKEFFIEIRPRGHSPYYRGETISFYINSSVPLSITISINDTDGYPFWKDVSWLTIPWNGYYVVPYWDQYEGVMSAYEGLWYIPHDAPLGTWTWVAVVTYGSTTKKFSGTFEVADVPYTTIITKLDELGVSLSEVNATLSGLITDVEGNLKAYIDTSLGPIIASLDEINAKLVSIENGVAEISTAVGDIKVSLDALDLSAINAKLESIEDGIATVSTSIGTVQTTLDDINAKVVSIDGNVATVKTDVGTVKTSVDEVKDLLEGVPPAISGVTTAVWIAVILSLVAAIAAIAAVVVVQRKIAG